MWQFLQQDFITFRCDQVENSLEVEADRWQQLFKAIGYWGQTSSLAWCTQVEEQKPSFQKCAIPLRQWTNAGSLPPFYSCILSEFQDTALSWENFLSAVGEASSKCLRLEAYLWPMILTEQ
jgi:hypothetical protein